MKLYHASKNKFDSIKRNQVEVPDGVIVPETELQNKIYLSPKLGFAIAMSAGPDGITLVENGKISFENADMFDPDKVVYVYEVDSNKVPEESMETIDEDQIAIDLDELIPESVTEYRANEVFNHYEFTSWVHPSESK